ncbi:MAG: M48 family metallopeptidase [Rhodobacteraceae bacterium]|nr:M48 family metallopeptidase [Paracoccaceae bacterium]
MRRLLLPGPPEVHLTLRRSARARRFSLRVSRVDGQVTLTLPTWAPEAEAMDFAREKAPWVRAALARRAPQSLPGFGTSVPVEGRMLALTAAPVRTPRIEAEALLLPPDAARLGVRLVTFLRFVARQRLQAACTRHAEALGRSFTRITLRDTRSRWGSCAPDGSLMFSWRLILAPPEVLEYVAAHEVAHLAEMNHSPAFWAVVARLCPGYAAPRAWLKQNGQALHSYRFTD